MNPDNNYLARRGRSRDHNHWYSSTYWRSNRRKVNTMETCHPSSADKQRVSDNIQFQPFGHLFGQNLRPYTESNPRLDSRQSSKRSNDYIEQTGSQKRLKIKDLFESPNSMVKDFRLSDINGHNSVDLFCQTCQMKCGNALDYSNHLSGRRHKMNLEKSEECNPLLGHLKRSKESIVGLKHIKEIKKDFFACDLCKCSEMTPNNAVQHINGYRHRRNFMTQNLIESEDKWRESEERHKKQSERRSISSSTQTFANVSEEDQSGANRRSNSFTTPSRSSLREGVCKQISESVCEKFDSSEKTVQNFRTIREICDQMIEYFSEKQKAATNMSSKNRSSTGKASVECLASKIKREN